MTIIIWQNINIAHHLSGSSLSTVLDCILEGLTFESVLGVVASQQSADNTALIRLQRDDNAEDWTEAALANKTAGMCVCIYGQPAIDAGGVRRQFFASCLAQTESQL